ncbi:MAG TPA: FAD-dependent oxidoreductase [Acidimicrobiales bacterium]|nr:FAD-dependent oxidoreductase [Acidimicrobiales bacterium]
MTGPSDAVDVVVIGGGLAGASVAYHVVAAGARAVLVDRHDAGRATDAGAGILSPETTRVAGEAWAALARDCGRYYRELARELPGDHGFGECGLLSVALGTWDTEACDELAARSPGLAPIGADEARARFPPLADVTRAYWNPGAARVDGRRFAAAVLTAAEAMGLERVAASADRVAPGRVEAGGRVLRCGAVVVSGGAWSPQVAAQVGADLPVAPERGQIAHLRVDADTSGWPIVSPVLGDYFVPWPGGRVATGATREPGAGFAAHTTVAGLRQLANEVARVAPGLVDAEVLEVRVGLRPASSDGLPVLGPVAGGVFVATGYGADGLLLSPWCGRLVASWALGAPVDDALEPFLATRFA